MVELFLFVGFVCLVAFVAGCNGVIYFCLKEEQETRREKITVGVFFGLITKEGKLRLQKRTEKGSTVTPGVSYKGDFELTGGGAKEKDFKKLLTSQGLFDEGQRETKEELGLAVSMPSKFQLYRAKFFNEKTGVEDWAITIPLPPECWDEQAEIKRQTIDINPEELFSLAMQPKGEQLLSGWGKRMCRMSLGAIFAASTNPKYVNEARIMLTEVKPDWRRTEYFRDIEEALSLFRKELHL